MIRRTGTEYQRTVASAALTPIEVNPRRYASTGFRLPELMIDDSKDGSRIEPVC